MVNPWTRARGAVIHFPLPDSLELCLLGSYTRAVDVWSTGCIIAEVIAAQSLVQRSPLSRKSAKGWQRLPLFPGTDHKDTVKRIVRLLGHPPASVLASLSKWEPTASEFVDRLPYASCDLETRAEVLGFENVPQAGFACSLGPDWGGPDWGAVFPEADPRLLSLLGAMLQYDPGSRISAEEALRHPYFAGADDLGVRRDAKRSIQDWDAFWTECESRRRRPVL